MAVDVPSGLDCDTGQPATHTVRADHTCTFAAMKIGFTQPAAKPFTGTVHVCDIGVPPRLLREIQQGPVRYALSFTLGSSATLTHTWTCGAPR